MYRELGLRDVRGENIAAIFHEAATWIDEAVKVFYLHILLYPLYPRVLLMPRSEWRQDIGELLRRVEQIRHGGGGIPHHVQVGEEYLQS